jgi:hypothetical protein
MAETIHLEYMGKPVETLTKGELIEALHNMHYQMVSSKESHEKTIKLLSYKN